MKHLQKTVALLAALTMASLLAACSDPTAPEPESRTDSSAAPSTTTAPLPPLSAEEAAQAYNEAYARLQNYEAVSFACHTKISLNDGRGWATVSIENETSLSLRNGGIDRLLVTGRLSGETASTFSQYYDGTAKLLYKQAGGEKYAMPVLGPDQATVGVGIALPYALSADALKALTGSRDEDGSIRLEGSVPAHWLGTDRDAAFLDAAFTAFQLSEDMLGDYNLKAAQITAVINRDGYLTSFSSSYQATIPGAAGDLPMSLECTVTFPSPGQDTGVTPPSDLDTYAVRSDGAS